MKKMYLLVSAVALIVLGAWAIQSWSEDVVEEGVPAEEVIAQVPVLTEKSCVRPDGALWNFAEKTLSINNQEIHIAEADTGAEKQRGIGGCEKLPEGAGMYFVFPTAGVPVFWMKDTLIPLDIVWVHEGSVVGVEHNIPIEPGVEDSNLKRYQPETPVTGALELPAGRASELGIEPGSTVEAGS